MSNLYRGPSINSSYQVSVHMAEGFQRRRLKCEKLTDDERQVMARWAKNEKLKINKIKFSCGFNKILNIERGHKVELSPN